MTAGAAVVVVVVGATVVVVVVGATAVVVVVGATVVVVVVGGPWWSWSSGPPWSWSWSGPPWLWSSADQGRRRSRSGRARDRRGGPGRGRNRRVVVVGATRCLRLSWATSWGLQTGAPIARAFSIGCAARSGWLRTATTAVVAATVGGPAQIAGRCPGHNREHYRVGYHSHATPAALSPTSALVDGPDSARRKSLGPGTLGAHPELPQAGWPSLDHLGTEPSHLVPVSRRVYRQLLSVTLGKPAFSLPWRRPSSDA